MAKLRAVISLSTILCGFCFGRLEATNFKGTVREVSDNTATVTMEGDVLPGVGDKGEIFSNWPGRMMKFPSRVAK